VALGAEQGGGGGGGLHAGEAGRGRPPPGARLHRIKCVCVYMCVCVCGCACGCVGVWLWVCGCVGVGVRMCASLWLVLVCANVWAIWACSPHASACPRLSASLGALAIPAHAALCSIQRFSNRKVAPHLAPLSCLRAHLHQVQRRPSLCAQVDSMAVSAALHACLCTDHEAQELRAGREQGRAVDDPFKTWPSVQVGGHCGAALIMHRPCTSCASCVCVVLGGTSMCGYVSQDAPEWSTKGSKRLRL